MMFKAEVLVSLKKGVLDPQGAAVEKAIGSLGYGNVAQVRIGKRVEFQVEAESKEEAEAITRELCRQVLTNPVMESFTFTLSTVEQAVAAVGGTNPATHGEVE